MIFWDVHVSTGATNKIVGATNKIVEKKIDMIFQNTWYIQNAELDLLVFPMYYS